MFIARILVNALTCPLTTVLNIMAMVMVAVITKRHLRTKSNIALAGLATTDLLVSIVLQPLLIAAASLLLKSEPMFCTIRELSNKTRHILYVASLHQLDLMGAERCLAIYHPFAYEALVTEVTR